MIINPLRWFGKERRDIKSNSPEFPNWIARLFGDFFQSSTGVHVTSETALKYTAYYAGVDHISRALVRMPILFFERDGEEERKRNRRHPVAKLLHDQPNPEQTPAVFKHYMQTCLGVKGNAYAEIQRDGAGRPIALWPIPPDNMRPARDDDGMLIYYFQKDAKSREIPLFAQDVLHFHGIGDGLVGYSPIALFADVIGLGLSAEKAGAKLYANGIRPTGVLQYQNKMKDDEAIERLRKQFQDRYGGTDNTGKPLLLEYGMEWKPITMSLSDAQFLETRVHQVREIARILHLPPHKIGDLERSTFSNIEEQNLEVVGDCYEPWTIFWQDEINSKLLMPSERERYFAEFQIDALLRANKESRARAQQLEIYSGTLTRNEARRMENRPALPGLDNPIMPVNYVPIGEDGKPVPIQNPQPQPDSGPKPADKDVSDSERSLLLEVCGRIVRMQAGALLKASKRADTPQEALEEVFTAEMEGRMASMLDAPVRVCADRLKLSPMGILPVFIRAYGEKCRTASISDVCEPPFTANQLTDLLINELTTRARSNATGA
jgi:HK97 family phage portal protein